MNNHVLLMGDGPLKDGAVRLPAVETFLDPVARASVWSEDLLKEGDFIRQTDERRQLALVLEDVLSGLLRPDMNLEEAWALESVSEERVERLFLSLSDLLEGDHRYRRIILYLPFELLPRRSWKPLNGSLVSAFKRFRSAYMGAWKGLLAVQDVRANFVDGDVLEVERRVGDLPRVVKAAHLAPILFERDWLSLKEIISLIDVAEDQLLKDDLKAALDFIRAKHYGTRDGRKPHFFAVSVESTEEELKEGLALVGSLDFGDVTDKRRNWLKRRQEARVLELVAKKIETVISNGLFDDSEARDFLRPAVSVFARQALVDGIRMAITSAAEEDRAHLYRQYESILLDLWRVDGSNVRSGVIKAFRHWRHLGVVDDGVLDELGIVMPKLFGRLSDNLSLMAEDMGMIRFSAESSRFIPELSKAMYPVVLVFGSRLKGYGEEEADIDLGIFFRPGVSLEEGRKLRDLIQGTFCHGHVGDEIMEFWLEEDGPYLRIRDFEDSDPLLGDSYWTHVLFGAAWEGDESSIFELRRRLLTPYLFKTDKVVMEKEARGLYLEEMERDLLLYRLLHKGYERFFPSCGGLDPALADLIDGRSMFYDSGYRQLATRLFVNRVFLPVVSL